MRYRTLGRTGLQVSAVAFGAGPVSGLMTGDNEELQHAVLSRAIDAGINWIDTAAGYGNGASERSLGRCLSALRPRPPVHLATKVRVTQEDADHPAEAIRRSLASSLQRLQCSRVSLLQIHNAITLRRGTQPASVSPVDVLRNGGIADVLDRLRAEGMIGHIGLTGTGEPDALREVIRSGRFDTIQAPYHLLNPSAASAVAPEFDDVDYGCIFHDCAQQAMGIFAIRVFAGGALLGNHPSPHTLTTPYFPLALFERDRRRAADLAQRFGLADRMSETAIRYVLSNPYLSSAIVGLGTPAEVDAAGTAADLGALPTALRDELEDAATR
jgi:aryl-alcohol dehydrogenase-like predicted oxidoreductase